MAFDEALANRVRKHIDKLSGLSEKKMFGGIAFLINGNMSVGVHKSELIVRIAPEETESALLEPGVRLFDITGRPAKGWLLVGSAGTNEDKVLVKWIRRSVEYASALPKKKK